QHKAAMAPPSAGGAPPSEHDQHEQIDQLEHEIEADRARLGLAQPMPAGSGVEQMSVAPAAPTCHPGTSDACTQQCTLSDSICKNGQKICDIAKQLGPDDQYAAEKCTSNNQTCAAAKTKCCSCQR